MYFAGRCHARISTASKQRPHAKCSPCHEVSQKHSDFRLLLQKQRLWRPGAGFSRGNNFPPRWTCPLQLSIAPYRISARPFPTHSTCLSLWSCGFTTPLITARYAEMSHRCLVYPRSLETSRRNTQKYTDGNRTV